MLSAHALVLATAICTAQVPGGAERASSHTLRREARLGAETKHLTVRATLSAIEAAPGARISIVAEITPRAGMHVYAPGGKYTPVTLRIDPHPFLEPHEVVYPRATNYFFAPLQEHAKVYGDPFRLVLGVTIREGKGTQPPAMPSRLPLKVTLEYQACDDTMCYLPVSVPLQWTLKVTK